MIETGGYIADYIDRLNCDYRCLELLEQARWPNGFVCPRCSCMRGYRITEYKLIQCASCKYQASATSGTIFHKSKIPLRKWFWAILLILTDKSGVSALRLQRLLEISYKTALLMLRKLRAVMSMENSKISNEAIEVMQAKLGKNDQSALQRVALLLAEQSCSSTHTEKRSTNNTALERTDKVQAILAVDANCVRSRRKAESSPLIDPLSQLRLKGTIALLRKFFLGTFHHYCYQHMQLYLDEFSYRSRQTDTVESIQEFLVQSCHTKVTLVTKLLIHSRKRKIIKPEPEQIKSAIISESISMYEAKVTMLTPKQSLSA